MANGSDAEILLQLLGARPEDLVAKRQSEILAQNPDAFSGSSSLLAGLSARQAQSDRENAQAPRRQAETRAQVGQIQDEASRIGREVANLPWPDPSLPPSEFNAQLGPLLFQLLSSPASNALNQANRIGGQDVDLAFHPGLTYGDAAENAGLPEWAQVLVDLSAGAVEPGPGEFAQAGRLISDLGPALGMLPFGRAARGNPAAESVLARSTDRITQGLPRDMDTFRQDLGDLMGKEVFTTGREYLNFGNDTEMTVSLNNWSGRPSLHINALSSNNPNMLGGGLKLTPEQRQIVTFFDLADANDIPITTSAAAFGHANLSTPELEFMYNRLGFEPDPDDPGNLIRRPVSLEWAARKQELEGRRLPDLEQPAMRMREVKRRVATGDAPTISESFIEHTDRSMSNYYARALTRHINEFVGVRQGQRLTPDMVDEISKFIGNAVGEARKTGRMQTAREIVSNRLGVTENVAWDLIFEYSRMVGFD